MLMMFAPKVSEIPPKRGTPPTIVRRLSVLLIWPAGCPGLPLTPFSLSPPSRPTQPGIPNEPTPKGAAGVKVWSEKFACTGGRGAGLLLVLHCACAAELGTRCTSVQIPSAKIRPGDKPDCRRGAGTQDG